MDCCGGLSDDLAFPMTAEVFYPIITQGLYGEIEKEWVFDRVVSCYAMSSTTQEEELKPGGILGSLNKIDQLIIARSPEDLRVSSLENIDASSNVLVSNIRLKSGEIVFKETAGPRAGLGTFFELAKIEPFVGPFDTIEYYKMVWRRTESQAIRD